MDPLDVATPYVGPLVSAKAPRVIAEKVVVQMLQDSSKSSLVGASDIESKDWIQVNTTDASEWRPSRVGRYASQAAAQEIIAQTEALIPGYITADVSKGNDWSLVLPLFLTLS